MAVGLPMIELFLSRSHFRDATSSAPSARQGQPWRALFLLIVQRMSFPKAPPRSERRDPPHPDRSFVALMLAMVIMFLIGIGLYYR